MKQTLKLSFEMTNTLSRIEHNGLKINTDTLEQIEKQYMDEMTMLETKLNRLATVSYTHLTLPTNREV